MDERENSNMTLQPKMFKLNFIQICAQPFSGTALAMSFQVVTLRVIPDRAKGT